MTKFDLSEQVPQALAAALSATVPERSNVHFGSRVTGPARPDSDLDLAVGGEARRTPEERRAMDVILEGLHLPFEVDVIDLEDAKSVFLKRVQSEWVRLSEACSEPAHTVAA